MTTTAECVRCGNQVQVEDYEIGRVVKCPNCHADVETDVQEAIDLEGDYAVEAELAEETPTPALALTPATGPATNRPRLKKKKKKKKPETSDQKKWLLIGLVSLPGVILVPLLVWGLATLLQTPPLPEIPADQWKVVEQPSRFKVKMPGDPKITRQPLGSVTMVNYALEYQKDYHFGVIYTEGQMPAERRALPAEQILKDSIAGALANMGRGAKEVSRKDVKLGDHPGKELIVRVPELGGKLVMRGYYDQGQGRLSSS